MNAHDGKISERTILVIGRDSHERQDFAGLFTREGFHTLEAADADVAESMMASTRIDLVVLDSRSSEDRAFSFCRRAAVDGGAAIIMVADRVDPTDEIIALEVGASDLMAAPVNGRLLLARGRALMRLRGAAVRAARAEQEEAAEGWSFDPITREAVSPRGHVVAISPSEASLFQVFLGNPGVVFTADMAADYLKARGITNINWRTSISRLRRKLERARDGQAIRTVRGSGYVYGRPAAAAA